MSLNDTIMQDFMHLVLNSMFSEPIWLIPGPNFYLPHGENVAARWCRMTFSGIQWHLVTLGDNAQETEVLLEYAFCARFHVFQIYLTHLFFTTW